jgi:hypothetical protein
MGQYIPDRMFWAREEKEARAGETTEEVQRADVRGSH